MNEKLLLSLLDRFSASQAVELILDDGDLHLSLRKESAIRSKSDSNDFTGPSTTTEVKESVNHEFSVSYDTIKSPIVAVFYASPGPDEEPFVVKGSKVKKGQSLCILEAMKMMNKLEAEFDCEIVAVLASSGQGVEYEQPLFTVKRI